MDEEQHSIAPEGLRQDVLWIGSWILVAREVIVRQREQFGYMPQKGLLLPAICLADPLSPGS